MFMYSATFLFPMGCPTCHRQTGLVNPVINDRCVNCHLFGGGKGSMSSAEKIDALQRGMSIDNIEDLSRRMQRKRRNDHDEYDDLI